MKNARDRSLPRERSLLLWVFLILFLSTTGAPATAADTSWPFDDASRYDFNNSRVEVSGSLARLKGDAWLDSNWSRRLKITVHADSIPEGVMDFPVYVDLSTLPSSFFNNVDPNGDDIRVTRSDGTTKVPREVVTVNTTSDTGELHFKAPALDGTSDTHFYIYYDNPSAGAPAEDSTYGAQNVWDSNFSGVWHLDETSGNRAFDSTSNGNDVELRSRQWLDPDWNHRIKITVNADSVPTDLNDFPVYVDLSTLPSSFFNNVDANGDDIRVTRPDGNTQVPREVVAIDVSGETGELHFKAPTLFSGSDTDYYIYYDNPSATAPAEDDPYGAQNVWTNNFKGVWHLSEMSGTTVFDATQNGNDGTIQSDPILGVLAQLGAGYHFDGGDDFLDFPMPLANPADSWTMQTWFKLDQTDSSNIEVMHFDHTQTTDERVGLQIPNSGGSMKIWTNGHTPGSDGTAVNANTWYHAAIEWDNSQFKLYRDGQFAYEVTPDTDDWVAGLDQFRLANSENSPSASLLDGLMDEARVSKGARSDSWISTQHNNQFDPENFYAVSTQQDSSGNLGTRPQQGASAQLDQGLDLSVSTDAYGIRELMNAVPDTEITVSFWTRATGDIDGMVTYGTGTGADDEEFMFFDQSNLQFLIDAGSGPDVGDVSDNVWHLVHGKWTSSGGDREVYVDGSSISTDSVESGYNIEDGGALVFGQDMDCRGGCFQDVQAFEGLLDEVRISNQARSDTWVEIQFNNQNDAGGFYSVGNEETSNDLYSDTSPTVVNNQGSSHFVELSSFSDTEGASNEGSISYQISNDGEDWYYHDGTGWVSASDSTTTNTESEINSNIASFDDQHGGGNFFFKAFLESDGSQKVQLDDVNVTFSGGTPVKPDDRLIADSIVIYDVHPAAGSANPDDKDEAITLYNPTDRVVALGNWQLIDPDESPSDVWHTIAEGDTVPAFGFFSITTDNGVFTEVDAHGASDMLESDAGGDSIILRNPSGVQVDALAWGNPADNTAEGTPLTLDGGSEYAVRKPSKGVGSERFGGGMIDGDDNASDFSAVALNNSVLNNASDSTRIEFRLSAPGTVTEGQDFTLSDTAVINVADVTFADSVATAYTGDSAWTNITVDKGSVSKSQSDTHTDGTASTTLNLSGHVGDVTVTYEDNAATGSITLNVQSGQNDTPSVDVIDPDTGSIHHDDVPGTYVITDSDDASGTVSVEVSYDSGVSWFDTPTVSGELNSVSVSSSGDTHTFTWDSRADLGSQYDTRVKLRLRGTDGTDTSAYDTSPHFTVDNVAPDTPSLLAPPDDHDTNATTIRFDWTRESDTGSGLNNYHLQVGGDSSFSSIVEEGDTTTSDTSFSLTEGTYFWRVFSRDNAGGTSGYTGAFSFTVDTSPPPVVSDLSGTATVDGADSGVHLFWNDPDTDVEHFDLYRVKNTTDTSGAALLDTVPLRADTITYTDSSATQGDSHYYYVTAVDTAGNVSDSSPAATAAHLTVSKSDNGDSPHRPGDTIVYTVTYTNDGFGPASTIVVVDALPSSTNLADSASVVSGPAADRIEYEIGGNWQSSFDPSATRVRWIINGDVDPQTSGDTGKLQFKAGID